VIALDTPLDPIDAADATFATDNFQAGLLIGQWAAATMGDAAASAKIAMLDLAISSPRSTCCATRAS
jgi:fructose transport system substrate-binding protein